ncbi:L-lactate dehydrogenase [Leptomonas pyrrhocoris]|uniref:L-lactate dehydrogenase n=1 Tax=Leptomonas pyrrhocoris TaxID=157538 RepID=A0A0M9G1F0_LEPPY|nr:L-lactate dehydrogenase [Leptomonas pyrrhocoris]XP_015658655.1 L-lactate dehydrogenase [Leptomonas pyrrhocoris]KPA80215.1 L-lactate dehydrogenase [Leptomonas pyrrhocoris]KPA80216.1 L-lactate dehydrogenase [Leptomonas pyrrhocoris]|eukprot:XP_015658654.1 L-lactate dehydrogenase [Leptomonas pyrrhocoris]
MSQVVKPRRVGIIGNGHVGSHIGYSLAIQGIADEIYFADCNAAIARSQAIDVQDAVTYMPHRVHIVSCGVGDLAGCDAIVLSAGPLPEGNESRLATLPRTMLVVLDIVARLKEHVMPTFKGVLISISNPADAIATYMMKALDLPPQRVICTGTCLDSARLQALLHRELKGNVSPASMQSAMMLGEHGDSSIVAWSNVRVGSKSLDQLQKENPERYPSFDRAALQDEARKRGYDVLLGKGSTEFGICTAAATIIKSVFHNDQRVLPCSVYLDGEYGEKGLFASVPVVIGANGVEDIIELELTPEEKAGFHHSCDVIRSCIQKAMASHPL